MLTVILKRQVSICRAIVVAQQQQQQLHHHHQPEQKHQDQHQRYRQWRRWRRQQWYQWSIVLSIALIVQPILIHLTTYQSDIDQLNLFDQNATKFECSILWVQFFLFVFFFSFERKTIICSEEISGSQKTLYYLHKQLILINDKQRFYEACEAQESRGPLPTTATTIHMHTNEKVNVFE